MFLIWLGAPWRLGGSTLNRYPFTKLLDLLEDKLRPGLLGLLPIKRSPQDGDGMRPGGFACLDVRRRIAHHPHAHYGDFSLICRQDHSILRRFGVRHIVARDNDI